MRNIVLMVISGLLAVALVVLLVMESKGADKRTEYLESVDREASVYRTQIHEIETDLHKRAKELETEDGAGKLHLAVKVTKASELIWAAGWLGEYGNMLSVVLDVAMDEAELDKLLAEMAKHPEWRVMFTGTGEGWLTDAGAIRGKLADLEIPDTGFAYFEEKEISPEQLKQLAEGEWLGYTLSLGNMASEAVISLDEQELVQIGHVEMADDNALVTLISDIGSDAFILAVEMDELNQGFNGQTVQRIMNRVETDYLGKEILELFSLPDYVVDYKEVRRAKEQKRQEYEAYAAERNKEIAVLNAKMQEIYNKADGKNFE